LSWSLSSDGDIVVPQLTWLIHWQNAPKGEAVCDQTVWKVMKFTEEWQLSPAITIRLRMAGKLRSRPKERYWRCTFCSAIECIVLRQKSSCINVSRTAEESALLTFKFKWTPA
jgi:hypothetical protein